MKQKKRWDVAVLGGINTDYLVRGSQLPAPGETQEGEEFQIGGGGKGANQAIAAARQGAKVCFIGQVGNDEAGKIRIRNLKREGIDAGCVDKHLDAPTGAALIMVGEKGKKLIYWFPGANRQMREGLIHQAKSSIERSQILLIQLEVPLKCISLAIDFAHEAGVRVILDAAPAVNVPQNLLSKVNIVRANTGEAKMLTGIDVVDRTSAREAAEKLIRSGAGAAILEAGAEGNLVVWPTLKWVNEHYVDELLLEKLDVAAIDMTGSGDAFCGALAARLSQEESLAEAATFANAAAALKSTKLGAQAGLPSREAVTEFLDSLKKKTAA